MNNAVFINLNNTYTPAECATICDAQDQIQKLADRIEIEVGVLDFRDGVRIVADMHRLRSLTAEITDNMRRIELAYESLIKKGVVKKGTAEPPHQF